MARRFTALGSQIATLGDSRGDWRRQRWASFFGGEKLSQSLASVSALSDFMPGRRGLDTLSGHQQAYRVMLALTAVGSILVVEAGDSLRPTLANARPSEFVGPRVPASDN